MGLFDSWNEKKKKNTKIAENAKKLRQLAQEIEDSKIKIQKLRNDPEYKKMKKKYNLQDVPGIDTDFGKKVDLDDFLKNTQKQIKKSRARAAKSKKAKK